MPKILLIDDDPRIENVFGQALRRAGHEVETATNGKEGIAKVNAAPPDLIITDIMMPEMDGLEILLAIRKTQPTIPVIAISGGMRALPINFLQQAKMFGARYVFHKPVPLDVLCSAVEDVLAKGDDRVKKP